ncbi:MAG: hypothetical protein R2747_02800 [Pyrinomonadaceae bacterium]
MMLKNIFKQISLFHKIVGFFLLVSIAVIGFAQISRTGAGEFAQARDFPDGPLVYVQFQDLPALLKLWDESEIKKKYLKSTNFYDFRAGHLALKLLSRLEEFKQAGGFPLDLSAAISSSEKNAALAVYDIGRIDLVFIAPMSEEKILASKFLVNRESFEETELEDGTVYYSREVEADRGRQKQKLLFAALNGRFVLGTDEVHFLRALSLINGKSKSTGFSENPAFSQLTRKFEPHLATVWVDQQKLNQDWYFKHYWAFKNPEELKNLRAGIFDFELLEDRLIERRQFLTAGNFTPRTSKATAEKFDQILEKVPAEAPYVKLQAVRNRDRETALELRNTVLEGFPAESESNSRSGLSKRRGYYYSDYDGDDWGYYQHLSGKYDSEVDQTEEEEEIDEAGVRRPDEIMERLEGILRAVNPEASATIISPRIMPMPLFLECRRGMILSLGNPGNLDRAGLENGLSALALNRVTLRGTQNAVKWKTVSENGREARILEMPGLGWSLGYVFDGRRLIFSNSPDFLSVILENKEGFKTDQKSGFDDLTIVNFDRHDEALDRIMRTIHSVENEQGEESGDFFVGNLGSLFEVLSDVKRAEIKRSSAGNRLSEQIVFSFEGPGKKTGD